MYLLLFIFGLMVGSFINVVSLRYTPGSKLFDAKIIGSRTDLSNRSHCPYCGKILAWYELIPIVSFLIQVGRCRECKHKLSFQYPLIEILTGLIFIFVPLTLINANFYVDLRGLTIISIIWIVIFILILLLSIIDFRHFIIPDSLNLTLAVLGIILIFINFYDKNFGFLNGSFLGNYALIFGLRQNIWLNYLFAGFLAAAVFGLIIFLSRGKAMGMGDVKLAAALGLIFGWPDILMVLFLGFLSGALVSAALLILKKKKIKDVVPFGPFLASGAVITFFFGFQIIAVYFKLFGL